jgi:H+-translocating diphosphatase
MELSATLIICVAGAVGLLWAYSQFYLISQIPVESSSISGESEPLTSNGGNAEKTARLNEIYNAIYEGAESFLRAEYTVCFWFILFFSILILVLVSWGTGWDAARGVFTSLSFLLGALTSMGCGYLGMKVAVYSNVRTTISAQKSGWTHCFNTAFRAGAVMGFALCSLGLLMLYGTMMIFRLHYPEPSSWIYLTECITGYGLGGSVIAMFGRVGGGIYTKAADVGADLVGKVVHGIPEDDPRNPATIADNVGDNVGDVAGMGADLFGSFAESTCAALVIGSSIGVSGGWDAMVFPVVVSAVGIFVCLICSFLATHIKPVKQESHVEQALKIQLISTTVVMIPAVYYTAQYLLPASFAIAKTVGKDSITLHPSQAALCVIFGAVGGLTIGLITVRDGLVGSDVVPAKASAFVVLTTFFASFVSLCRAGVLHVALVPAGPGGCQQLQDRGRHQHDLRHCLGVQVGHHPRPRPGPRHLRELHHLRHVRSRLGRDWLPQQLGHRIDH